MNLQRTPCVEPVVPNALPERMRPIPYHQQRLEG